MDYKLFIPVLYFYMFFIYTIENLTVSNKLMHIMYSEAFNSVLIVDSKSFRFTSVIHMILKNAYLVYMAVCSYC